jgi:hypothetical protein
MQRQMVAPVFGHTSNKSETGIRPADMRTDEQQHSTMPPRSGSFFKNLSIHGRHIELDGADICGNVTIADGDNLTANIKNVRARNTKSLFKGKNHLIRMENVQSEKGAKLL